MKAAKPSTSDSVSDSQDLSNVKAGLRSVSKQSIEQEAAAGEQTMYGNMYGEDVTLNWAYEVDREFPLEYTFENISSDELEVTSQGGLEDISSDELEEINITLENVSEGDFDI